MKPLLKLSGFQKKIMLALYLISFPLGLFAYSAGFRDAITALAGLELLLALAVSESKSELIIVILTMLAGGMSEMVNVQAGNWSYAPGGGFIEKAQIPFVSFVWGILMWTIYNLAQLTKNRKNLPVEVGAAILALLVFALTQPKFYFDPSTLLLNLLFILPWYLFYRASTKLEKAVLVYAVFIGFYNELFGIISNVWFWESLNRTNILTLIAGGFGYSLPVWVLFKIGFMAGKTDIN